MRLHRVEIRNFRKLRGPVVIDGLGGHGLAVIAGDNEEGKSTVLHALKAAFFEHHAVGGAVRSDMEAYDAPGAPEVAVEFELGGGRWALRKVFKKGGVALDGPGGRLGDDAAERRLQELLRFERRAGRSAAGPQFQGLMGLFWLDQGTSFATGTDDAVAHARDRVRAAIGGEVAAAADGGLGRDLLARAREQCARFWTEKTWRERGELEDAAGELRAREAELAPLRERRRAAEAKCDRLARLRGERRRAQEGDDLGRAKARLRELAERLAGLAGLEQERARARDRLGLAEAERERVAGRERARAERRRVLAELERRREVLAAEEAGARGAAEAAAAALREAEAGEAAAAAALAAAQAEEALLARAGARLGHERERTRLAAALGQVREAEDAAAEAARDLAANPATAERLKAVLDRHAALATARAELAAAATRIELRPASGGAPRALTLTERTELELEGYGTVVVLPGGRDIAERHARVAEAEAALGAALAAAGGRDLAHVEGLARGRRAAEERAAEGQTRLRVALRAVGEASADALAGRLAQVELELGRLHAGDDPAAPADLEAALDAARRGATEAGARLDAARAASRAADRAVAAARQDAAIAAEKLAQLAERAGGEGRALAAELAAEPDEDLDAAARRTGEERERAADALDAIERHLRSADPELLRDRHAIASRDVQAAEAEARRREDEIRDLEIELRARGDEGIGERVAEAEAALAAAGARLRRVRLEARAWRMLHDELAAADAASRETLLEPVLERLRPWLGRLFPGAEPALDADALALAGIRRNGVVEPIHKLSVGTREQLAVLVRLGLAQLLREREGEAPCLVLDDALVYADEARFDAMKAILQRAAQEQQVLVLTCRPRDYRGLDARLIRLEGCTA